MARLHSALLLVCLCLAALHAAVAQLAFPRNRDDCIFPPLTVVGGYNFFPPRFLLSSDSTTKLADGGTRVWSSTGFHVEYYSTFKIIYNRNLGETFVAYLCGTPRPNINIAGAKFLEIPLTSISVDDTTAAALLNELNLADRIAYSSDLALSPCLQATARGCGFLAPDPRWGDAGQIAAVTPKVDAFLTYGNNVNTKSIGMQAPSSQTPVRRAEWTKYLALFFNREVEANNLHYRVRTDYTRLSSAIRAALPTARQTVCWTSAPLPEFLINQYAFSYAPYKRQYVLDAGGQLVSTTRLLGEFGATQVGSDYTWPDSDAGFARFTEALKQCDVILAEDYAPGTGGLARYLDFLNRYRIANGGLFKALRSRRVYTLSGIITAPVSSGPNAGLCGTDWFERAVVRPDLVLNDFVAVMYPTNRVLPAGYQPRWLYRLETPNGDSTAFPRPPTILTSGSCRLPVATQNCARRNGARICPNAVYNCSSNQFLINIADISMSRRCLNVDRIKRDDRANVCIGLAAPRRQAAADAAAGGAAVAPGAVGLEGAATAAASTGGAPDAVTADAVPPPTVEAAGTPEASTAAAAGGAAPSDDVAAGGRH